MWTDFRPGTSTLLIGRLSRQNGLEAMVLSIGRNERWVQIWEASDLALEGNRW